MKKRWIFLLALLLFCGGCVLLPSGKPPVKIKKIHRQSIKKQLKPWTRVKKAGKRVHRRTLRKSTRLYLTKTLKQKIPPGVRDVIQMTLARHFMHKKSYKKALKHYVQVKHNPWKEQAMLTEAGILWRLKQYEKATEVLGILVEGDFKTATKKQAYALWESILLKQSAEDPVPQLKMVCQVLKQSIATKKDLEKARKIVFSLKDSELLALLKEDFIQPVADGVFFRAGKILFFREEFYPAWQYFKKALKFASHTTLEARALKYVQAIESRKKVHPFRVGAVLPLSGSSLSVGRRSLKGLEGGFSVVCFKKNRFSAGGGG